MMAKISCSRSTARRTAWIFLLVVVSSSCLFSDAFVPQVSRPFLSPVASTQNDPWTMMTRPSSWSSMVASSVASDLLSRRRVVVLLGSATPQSPENNVNDDEDEEEEEEGGEKKNPYADPNYPQLEFVDYSDPNYRVDQGVSDEFFQTSSSDKSDATTDSDNTEPSSTEEQIEEMREDRRRKNDEFQFQTYFTKVLKSGEDEYKGEWTVYKTSTFLADELLDASEAQDENGFPRLVKAARTLPVVSRGYKTNIERQSDEQTLLELERIIHHERIAATDEADSFQSWQDDLDTDTGFGRHNLELGESSDNDGSDDSSDDSESAKQALSAQAMAADLEILAKTYWPAELAAEDFRGHQGIMCVGGAYTIATAVSLDDNDNDDDEVKEENISSSNGPFSEYRAEIGIQSKQLRFRIKFDYAVLEEDQKRLKSSSPPPPLHLRTLTICREMLERWPPRRPENGSRKPTKFRSLADRTAAEALFGPEGAEGGLYDPPPVGSDARASKYMMLDLEGRASTLFPYIMEQVDISEAEANGASSSNDAANGWVMTLDWTPGSMRYQVDRKMCGGEGMLGLRTLELSEVQSMDAETYRPRDGGSNMRQ